MAKLLLGVKQIAAGSSSATVRIGEDGMDVSLSAESDIRRPQEDELLADGVNRPALRAKTPHPNIGYGPYQSPEVPQLAASSAAT